MKIQLLNEPFKVLDTKEKITIADSFVVRQNKIGGGNGEAKLYIGQENQETRDFFGIYGFGIKCFLLKKDLLKYLEETKQEYLNPEQPYLNREILPNLWNERLKKVSELPERIEFEVTEQTQIDGPRIYIKSNDKAYKLIRELSLPNITYISAVKLLDDNGKVYYYFRLFADYFGNVEHPYTIEKEQQEIDELENTEEKKVLSRARIGQGKYREELLKLCPFCPITLVSDDRMLIASHIKPWAKSSDFEKTDPLNGFMLSPTFDFMFDRGFLSFTDDKKSILSPFLSKMTYSKLGISDGKTFSHLPVDGRKEYLEYHRTELLKR
ncbi:HNH endonuclease [Tamlana sp. 62-3]|uniref:HNH endonuclease n=1 Tax=Neotamlana sargassicola TaxID=2883125 RepID=A0A9X1L898_9FLAO|nr:HNH endonuclease signature motif containing protein [Tamlana sargassicola]MCB4809631.1 HNH endonuclease [Tamlana sargassicola]